MIGTLLDTLLTEAGLMKVESNVAVECFKYDTSEKKQTNVECDSGEPGSVMWTIPFGMSIEKEVPLDFKIDAELDAGIDFELEFGSSDDDDLPIMKIGFDFKVRHVYLIN